MRRFLPYFKLLIPLKWAVLGAITSGIVASATNGFGLPFIVDQVLPKLFPKDGGQVDRDQLLTYVLLIPLAFFIRGSMGFANQYLTGYCGTKVLEAMRIRVFEHLLHLPLAFFQGSKSGDLYSRVMSDTSAIRLLIVNEAANIVRLPVQLLGAVGFVVFYCIKTPDMAIFLAWLAGVPIFALPIVAIGKKVKRRSRQLQEQTAVVSENLIESLQAPQEIRVFNFEQPVLTGFKANIDGLIRSQLKVMKYVGIVGPVVEVLSAIGISAALLYAGVTSITLEQLVPLLIALHMAYDPMKKIGQTFQSARRAEASLDRLEHILNQPDTLPEPEKPLPLDDFREAIRFEHVGFGYNSGETVLRDIDLTIGKGEVVALVGPSGAGKSTFTKLIPRLFDPTEGRILLDGHPLSAYSKRALRELVGVVSQDPILFNDTIRDNILVGRQGASTDEVEAAAVSAHAHEFIMEFDKGYDTIVGERGSSLSGGQIQRIAIARAFLRDAPILILDESTSALDSESESMVQSALGKLIVSKTVFIIAHRFSTTRVANRVLVFDAGRIVADGTHDEVYATSARYRTLYDFQTSIGQ